MAASVVSAPEERRAVLRARPHLDLGAWGSLPLVTLLGSCGLLLVAVADGMSRNGRPGAMALFWAGVLLIVVPAAFRLSSDTAERRERIALVVVFGVLLYLVKVVRDPYTFTFGDELLHIHNANQILSTHSLFGSNSILRVSPRFPGLETVSTALAAMSGLSPVVSGLVVVGAARLLMMLALYLLFELVGGSSRVAGLATLLYAVTPNFLYFTAQFAYESLALPLAVAVVLVAAHATRAPNGDRRAWLGLGVLLGLSVVATHHLTSYATAAFLAILCLLYFARRRDRMRSAPWELAIFMIVASIAWLLLAAPFAVHYLLPIFGHGVKSISHTFKGHASVHNPLTSGSGLGAAALLGYAAALGVAALLIAGAVFGFRSVRRRHGDDPFVLLLVAAGLAYLVVLPLRFSAGAVEIANRSSAFLGIGMAFLLASAGLERWHPRAFRPAGRILLTGSVAALFVGGVIAGWPASLLLARPDRVADGAHKIEAPGFVMARWSLSALGPNKTIAADASNGRLLLVYGNQNVFTSHHADAIGIIRTPLLSAAQVQRIRQNRIRYVLVDRRRISWDPWAGYFFSRGRSPKLFPSTVYGKFDRQKGVSRIFDSGDIAIYDVKGLWSREPRQ